MRESEAWRGLWLRTLTRIGIFQCKIDSSGHYGIEWNPLEKEKEYRVKWEKALRNIQRLEGESQNSSGGIRKTRRMSWDRSLKHRVSRGWEWLTMLNTITKMKTETGLRSHWWSQKEQFQGIEKANMTSLQGIPGAVTGTSKTSCLCRKTKLALQ